MLTVLNNLESLRKRRLHRLAQLWTISRTDGVSLRFTNHSHALVYEGNTYSAAGFGTSARQRQTGLKPTNQELVGLLSSDKIEVADLQAGRYDNAIIEVLDVDWMYPFAGPIGRTVYVIESITHTSEEWKASVVGLSALTQRATGDIISRVCMNDLGDGVCRINLATGTVARTVGTVVDSRRIITANLSSITNPYTGGSIADGYFDRGRLTWTSGANVGIAAEIRSHVQSSGTLEFELEMPFDIAAGDAFALSPGCDQLLATCISRFANRLNYLGAPQAPNNDKMLYPR